MSRIPFAFESLTVPQELKAVVTYKLKDNSEDHQMEFSLKFPCSSFIIPSPVEKTAFSVLITSEAKEGKTCSLNSDLKKAVGTISAHFHVKVVEQDEEKASLYGRTTHDHHVAFLLKINESSSAPQATPAQPTPAATETTSAPGETPTPETPTATETTPPAGTPTPTTTLAVAVRTSSIALTESLLQELQSVFSE